MYRKISGLAIVFFFCASAFAQNYVSLYDQCNYSGRKYTLEAGSYRLYQMKIGNDKLSSMEIPNGFKVTIYENDGFGGRSATYSSHTACLDDGWRNTASSIVVEDLYANSGYTQNDYVTFFNDCYSRGYSQSLRPGRYSANQLGNLKYNLSSFSISGNLRVKLYLNNDNLSGYSVTYDASQSCLPDNQNDKVGSLIIEARPYTPPTGGNNGNTGNYVTMYGECNYGGNALRLVPGYYQGDKLGIMKYNIASIQVPSGLRVKAYVSSEYLSGQSYTISENMNCMSSSLRNRIASIMIEETGYNNNNNNYPGTESVIIYVDEDYRGQSATLLPGRYATMAQAGFIDNALSSLYVPPGFRVVIYEEENFRGDSYTITASKPKFYLSGWSDKTSSIAVYKD
jgi:Beta/Gamma crystallin